MQGDTSEILGSLLSILSHVQRHRVYPCPLALKSTLIQLQVV